MDRRRVVDVGVLVLPARPRDGDRDVLAERRLRPGDALRCRPARCTTRFDDGGVRPVLRLPDEGVASAAGLAAEARPRAGLGDLDAARRELVRAAGAGVLGRMRAREAAFVLAAPVSAGAGRCVLHNSTWEARGKRRRGRKRRRGVSRPLQERSARAGLRTRAALVGFPGGTRTLALASAFFRSITLSRSYDIFRFLLKRVRSAKSTKRRQKFKHRHSPPSTTWSPSSSTLPTLPSCTRLSSCTSSTLSSASASARPARRYDGSAFRLAHRGQRVCVLVRRGRPGAFGAVSKGRDTGRPHGFALAPS